MQASNGLKVSFSLHGRMSRGPYIIISVIYFIVSLLVAAQMSLSARVVIDKFLAQSPGLRAAATASGSAHAFENYDYTDRGDQTFDTGAYTHANAAVYLSDADARDVKSNYALMYQSGVEHGLEITLELILTVVFVIASSNRFHDIGQPGFFAILLFVPVPLVLWLYLILAPPRDCPPAAPKPGEGASRDKPAVCGPVYIKNDHSVHM
jgi:uncharacterized membrane protein YhaH (DUF805 family)